MADACTGGWVVKCVRTMLLAGWQGIMECCLVLLLLQAGLLL